MCPSSRYSEPSLDTVANRCRVASGAPSAKILYAGHAAVHVSPTHGGMPAIPATRRVIPDDGRLARCSENRAPYRDRLVWSVAPFAVRTDDMGGTLYAMTVCARAVRQRNAGLQAAIARTVRVTAQTARPFPCPAGKARERRPFTSSNRSFRKASAFARIWHLVLAPDWGANKRRQGGPNGRGNQ